MELFWDLLNNNISTVHIAGSLRRILTQLNQPSLKLSPSLALVSLLPCVLTLSPLSFKCLLMIPWIWFVYCFSLSDSSLLKHWTCLEPEFSESKLAVRHTPYLWLSCQLVTSHSSLKRMIPKTNVVNLPVTQLCFLCSLITFFWFLQQETQKSITFFSLLHFHFHLFWSLGSPIFSFPTVPSLPWVCFLLLLKREKLFDCTRF